MRSRACITAITAAVFLLLGPAVAQAEHVLSVSKSKASAGEEVEFQITGTQAGESYIVKVEDQEVASGVDSAGNGVSDKFKMPDFGSTDRAVLVEVDITTLGGNPNHSGSKVMDYLAAPSGSSGGGPAPQPVPVTTVTDPAPAEDPVGSSTPPPVAKVPKNPPTEDNPKSGGGGDSNPDNTPANTPNSDPAESATGGTSSRRTRRRSSTIGADITSQVPPGPTGPSAPVGSSIASVLSPLSGIAQPGKTGFPILLLLLVVLLIGLGLTAAGPRLWQRWEPALPWGPDVEDDVRLGALSRASASGAELQQTIADRKASRSAGRTV